MVSAELTPWGIPGSPSHLRNFVERDGSHFAIVRAIRVGIGTGRLRDLAIHVGSIMASSGLQSSFLEADGTRSTQDVRRPWTKCSSDSQNRMSIRCAQWNASRDDAWRRRRVTVARPVRFAFCTNLRFSLTF